MHDCLIYTAFIGVRVPEALLSCVHTSNQALTAQGKARLTGLV